MVQSTDSSLTPGVIRATGELNALTSGALREQIKDLLAQGNLRLLVDLSGVSFIDSSGLSALVAGLKAAKQQGGNLALFGLQEQALMIFEITQAHTIFDILPTEADALAMLQREA